MSGAWCLPIVVVSIVDGVPLVRALTPVGARSVYCFTILPLSLIFIKLQFNHKRLIWYADTDAVQSREIVPICGSRCTSITRDWQICGCRCSSNTRDWSDMWKKMHFTHLRFVRYADSEALQSRGCSVMHLLSYDPVLHVNFLNIFIAVHLCECRSL